MTKVTVLGGTGFAGGWIAREAASRGLEVTTLSRSVPNDLPASVHVVQGSLLDAETLHQVIDGADVVVAALSPRGDMAGKLRPAYAALADALAVSGGRLIVVGGFGSLKAGPEGPRIVETGEFPAAFKDEARELAGVLDDLQARHDDLAWTFVSPAANFGAYIEDQSKRGTYRVGGEFPVTDAEGVSQISGPDFAIAIVDEIERADHVGEQITVAY